jgi:hypothetical protein
MRQRNYRGHQPDHGRFGPLRQVKHKFLFPNNTTFIFFITASEPGPKSLGSLAFLYGIIQPGIFPVSLIPGKVRGMR